jgi:hypothetical protein
LATRRRRPKVCVQPRGNSRAAGTKRNGERFTDAAGREWRADGHAGLTSAAWLLLRQRESIAAVVSGDAPRDMMTAFL